jgi:hypothetical protein
MKKSMERRARTRKTRTRRTRTRRTRNEENENEENENEKNENEGNEDEENEDEEDRNQEKIKFYMSLLKPQPGATLFGIRERYGRLIEGNLAGLLFKDRDSIRRFTSVRRAYEFVFLPLLRDEHVPVQKYLASEEDARWANIPFNCHYSTWDPTEEPFIFLYWAFDAHSLGEFFDDLALIHGCSAMELDSSMELRVHLVVMAKYMKLLDYKAPVSPFMISGQSFRALH